MNFSRRHSSVYSTTIQHPTIEHLLYAKQVLGVRDMDTNKKDSDLKELPVSRGPRASKLLQFSAEVTVIETGRAGEAEGEPRAPERWHLS